MGFLDQLKGWFGPQADSPASKDGKPRGLRVSDYLTEKSILFLGSGPSKQQALGHLIAALDLPDPNTALQTILSREEAGSTIVDPGLALPHARVPGVTKLKAAIGIFPQGIVDPQSDSGPVYIYVLFVGSPDNMKEHLGFLAHVSAVFQSVEFRDRMVRAGSAARALDLIRKAEAELH
jgi:PTS system nitrogen regulatory IIA component